jgi:hypothetical protein
MFNRLMVVDLGAEGSDAAADALVGELNAVAPTLPELSSALAGRTTPGAVNGGHLMWRLAFESEQDHRTCTTSRRWREAVAPALSADKGIFVDSAAYRPSASDASAGRARPGLWRCLLLAVRAGTPTSEVRRFETDMLLMPDHVKAIRNWAFGPVLEARGRRPWTHVWEQEYDDISGLAVDYMGHPVHWGLIDGWYDVESPQCIVDPTVIHATFPISSAIIR